MEYSTSWWLSYWGSILIAYTLRGWSRILSWSPDTSERWPSEYGNGFNKEEDGYDSRHEDGKPWNSGDPRAG